MEHRIDPTALTSFVFAGFVGETQRLVNVCRLPFVPFGPTLERAPAGSASAFSGSAFVPDVAGSYGVQLAPAGAIIRFFVLPEACRRVPEELGPGVVGATQPIVWLDVPHGAVRSWAANHEPVKGLDDDALDAFLQAMTGWGGHCIHDYGAPRRRP